jgi:hypothetical protein
MDYKSLLDKIIGGEHFALARFNDGEMKAVHTPKGVVARGDQPVVKSLTRGLLEVLDQAPALTDFYLGRPCSKCFSWHYQVFHVHVSKSYRNQTQATVLINNGRWLKSFEAICRAAQDRPVYWIGQPGHDLSCFEARGLSRPVQYTVPAKDAWKRRGEVEDLTFPEHSLVLLSCGPLSRWLTYKYWTRQPGELTILDIGSLLDPLTRDVWHACHYYNKKSRRCRECDNDFEDDRLRADKDEIRRLACPE